MWQTSRHLLVLGFLLTTGCSTITGWFSDDEFDPREPVELEKITEQVKLKSRWSRGVGDGQGEGLLKINPILVGDSLYVASAEGRVMSVDPESGRVRWKQDLDLALSGALAITVILSLLVRFGGARDAARCGIRVRDLARAGIG